MNWSSYCTLPPNNKLWMSEVKSGIIITSSLRHRQQDKWNECVLYHLSWRISYHYSNNIPDIISTTYMFDVTYINTNTGWILRVNLIMEVIKLLFAMLPLYTQVHVVMAMVTNYQTRANSARCWAIGRRTKTLPKSQTKSSWKSIACKK